MNYRTLTSAAVVAVFLISVSSALLTDGSDAYEMKEGENGIGYSIKDLSKEDQDKILPPSLYNGSASYILGIFLDSAAYYDITSVDVTDYASSAYRGDKVSGKDYEDVIADTGSSKMTFVATCNSDGNDLFLDNSAFSGVMKAVGLANKTQSGAKFTVTAKIKNEHSTMSTYTYESNSAGDLVLTKERIKNYALDTLDIEVRYSFTAGDGPKEISFDVDYGQVVSMDFTNRYDFAGVAIADVTESDRCIIDQDADSYYRHDWLTCKYDGDRRGADIVDMNFQNSPEYRMYAFDYATVAPYDISVMTYGFYDSGADSNLFGTWSNIDDSLRSNDAMKQFLDRNGSITETYSGAESGAEGVYDNMNNMEGLLKILNFIGIVFLLFIVAVVVLIVILVKVRKKH